MCPRKMRLNLCRLTTRTNGLSAILWKPITQHLHINNPPSISFPLIGVLAMGDLKHLVVVKFKEEAVVEELLNGMKKLVSEVDVVKSFEWGQDVGSNEMLTQGFTHIISMTFGSSEDFAAFLGHPSHVEFSVKFSAAIEKILVFDFPVATVKSSA